MKQNIIIASAALLLSSIFFVINDAIINYLSSNKIQFYHFVFYGAPAYIAVPIFLFISGNLKKNLICNTCSRGKFKGQWTIEMENKLLSRQQGVISKIESMK